MRLDSIDVNIIEYNLNSILEDVSLSTPAVWTDEDKKSVKESIENIKELLKIK